LNKLHILASLKEQLQKKKKKKRKKKEVNDFNRFLEEKKTS
jgi:hypothetical protein